MKKILVLILLTTTLLGCKKQQSSQTVSMTNEEQQDTIVIDPYVPLDGESTIDYMCRIESNVQLTLEEAAHWDSLNSDGGYLLVRGAERDLDTIVNHIRMIFTTEP